MDHRNWIPFQPPLFCIHWPYFNDPANRSLLKLCVILSLLSPTSSSKDWLIGVADRKISTTIRQLRFLPSSQIRFTTGCQNSYVDPHRHCRPSTSSSSLNDHQTSIRRILCSGCNSAQMKKGGLALFICSEPPKPFQPNRSSPVQFILGSIHFNFRIIPEKSNSTPTQSARLDLASLARAQFG